MKKKILLSIFIILLLLVVSYFFTDWGFLSSEITEYPVQCKVKVVYNECTEPMYTLRWTRYKVLVNQQKVVYWTDGFEVQNLIDCAIKNRKNWTCEYSDHSAKLGFNEGEYFEDNLKPSLIANLENIYHVSRYKYNLLNLVGE